MTPRAVSSIPIHCTYTATGVLSALALAADDSTQKLWSARRSNVRGSARWNDLRVDILAGTCLHRVDIRSHITSALIRHDLAKACSKQTWYTYTPAGGHQICLQGRGLEVGGLELGALCRVNEVAGALHNCESMTVFDIQIEPRRTGHRFNVFLRPEMGGRSAGFHSHLGRWKRSAAVLHSW